MQELQQKLLAIPKNETVLAPPGGGKFRNIGPRSLNSGRERRVNLCPCEIFLHGVETSIVDQAFTVFHGSRLVECPGISDTRRDLRFMDQLPSADNRLALPITKMTPTTTL
jgi:hypothetical protein